MPYCHRCSEPTPSIEYEGTHYCTRCEGPYLLPQIADEPAWNLFVSHDAPRIMERITAILKPLLLNKIQYRRAQYYTGRPENPLSVFGRNTLDLLTGSSGSEYGCIGCGCSATAVLILLTIVAMIIGSVFHLGDEDAWIVTMVLTGIVFVLIVIGSLSEKFNIEEAMDIREVLTRQCNAWLATVAAVQVTQQNYPEIKTLELILSAKHSNLHTGHWILRELEKYGVTSKYILGDDLPIIAARILGIDPPPEF